MIDEPRDFADEINRIEGRGWSSAMGLRFITATLDHVVAELDVAEQHLQPYGIVHGGVHAGVIESLASVGAALNAREHGHAVVGLENHTSFLRAARAGTLRAEARPISRGRRTQVWEGSVFDAEGRLLASGRVRLLSLDPESSLAGEKIAGESSAIADDAPDERD